MDLTAGNREIRQLAEEGFHCLLLPFTRGDREGFYWINNKNMALKKENNFAFIDSQNLNLGIQELGWKLEYKKSTA